MDKKVEEIVRKKSLAAKGLRDLFRQSESTRDPAVDSRDGVVVEVDPSEFPACPIIDITDSHYFHTIDGRTLVFGPDQRAPYIFLPFPLRRALFHSSEDREYFVTLDTSNKLQYSPLVNGHPSEERHIISRNVVQVVQQSGRLFYVSSKNDVQHVNTVWNDGGVLRGRMCVPGIKTADLAIFCANATLFLRIDSQLQREDGKKLSLQGSEICELGDRFLVLERTKDGTSASLLDEKLCQIGQPMQFESGRMVSLFPLGPFAVLRIDSMLHVLGADEERVVVRKEISIGMPLALCLSFRDNSIVVSKIVSAEPDSLLEESLNTLASDSLEEGSGMLADVSERMSGISLMSRERKDADHGDADGLWDRASLSDRFLDDMKDHFGYATGFEPYSPDRSQAAGLRGVEAVLQMQQELREEMRCMERMQNERFAKLMDMFSAQGSFQMRTMVQESVKKEVSHVSECLKGIESRLREGVSGESRVLESVKKIVLDTLVPVVETCMDEMRIQVVNEMHLIHSEDHLKGVKKAVDGLHTSFNRQNEIKNLISQGMIDRAADIALKGSEFNLDAFVSNVEISCLEHLSSSVLVALLEKMLVMSKNDLKPHYQSFLYMVMVCLDLDDLSDEEMQVLEILMSYINSIEGLPLNDNKALSAIVDFQKLKLNKIKSKKGFK